MFLTPNGSDKFVVMDIKDYEREKAEKKLLMKLHEAEEATRDENAYHFTPVFPTRLYAAHKAGRSRTAFPQ